MKKLFLIFIFFIFPSGYFFAKEMDCYASIQATEESFDLEINDNVKVNVTLSGDLIKTNNRIMDKNRNFQIDFYIQHNQLFHFKWINSEEASSKSFNAKFNKKNGLGYYRMEADYELDFLFPRERDENPTKIIEQFSKNPDFVDNEHIVNYTEALFRIIESYILDNIGTITITGKIIHNERLKSVYYRFDNEKYKSSQKIEIKNGIIDNETKKEYGIYHIEFKRNELKNHQKIFFSHQQQDLQPASLINQNSIDLAAVRNIIAKEIFTKHTYINSDLFLSDLDKLIPKKESVTIEDKAFIGTYSSKNYDGTIRGKFELLDNYLFHHKEGDVEEFGNWKLGENHRTKVIIVYNNYKINTKTGAKTKEYGFQILIMRETYSYPLGSGRFTEYEKD
ncbi:MAG: hypothetical protein Q4A09_09480 [Capnocytophaga felis]|nr:hypothetical protein [Capnocytophaga felis]